MGVYDSKIKKDVQELNDLLKGVQIAKGDLDKIRLKQIIYFGAPGTGKSFKVESDGSEDDRIRTTFHPDTDYSSFVGCYKPQQDPGDPKRIIYKFEAQCFTIAYIKAWKRLVGREDNENINFTLVIEEINRGNCAQIFGDIFQLLDRNKEGFSQYGIRPDEDLAAHLKEEFAKYADAIKAYNNGKYAKIADGTEMKLPPNLSIVATMNTSDQSLFPIDSAFKRRWEWEYIPIQYKPIDSVTNKPIAYKINIDGALYDWGMFIQNVNARISSLTLSEDKQLGYFFVNPGKDDFISEQRFVSKVIFYLWSDIFKDLSKNGESIFHFSEDDDKKNKVVHTFNSFFDISGKIKTDLVKKFIEQFDGLSPINLSGESSKVKYKVDGNLCPSYAQLASYLVQAFVKRNQLLDANAVINSWKIIQVNNNSNFISDVQRSGTWDTIECANGTVVYVTRENWYASSNGQNKANISQLIDAVKNANWGIDIEEVKE